MLKRIILSILMLGFVTQAIPAKADESNLYPSATLGEAITTTQREGLLLNSYTIPIVNNCMTSISFTTKQKIGLFGLVVVIGASQAVYKIYRTAQNEYNQDNLSQKIPNIHQPEQTQNNAAVTQEQFEEDKSHLSKPLQSFLDDFATWSQEEKNAIQISTPSKTIDSSGIIVNGLSQERQAAYEGNLAQWLKNQLDYMVYPPFVRESNTIPFLPPYLSYRIHLYHLKNCIEYLKQ